MLEVRAVAKRYGDVEALRGIDLDVAAGQIVSLLGRNGAGKTTTLSIVAGLLAPDAGTVVLDGVDVLATPERASSLLGIAPQETGIYPVLTARENLEFFAELNGVGRSDRHVRVDVVAERLGLTGLLDRKAATFSGGEARRLHTACALMHRPKLLMLDEPTVGADVSTRSQLIEAVRELADDGAAVIYTTHYLPEVEALEADVVIIDGGEVLAVGTQDELIRAHSLEGLRVHIDGAPPDAFSALDPVVVGGGIYRIERSMAMAELLDALGDEAARLRSVEQLQPDLETVFLAVSGSRLDDEVEAAGVADGQPAAGGGES